MPDKIHTTPSEAEAADKVVYIHGPDDVEIAMTPKAALESAKNISDAAIDALVDKAAAPSTDEETPTDVEMPPE